MPTLLVMLMGRSSLLFLVLKVQLLFVIVQVLVVVHKLYLSVVVGIQFSNLHLYIDFQISPSPWKIV